MADKEQRIREAAYRIWEEEGYPDGQADRHWEIAVGRIEAADGEDAKPSPDSKISPAAAGAVPIAPAASAPPTAATKREPPVKAKPGKRGSSQVDGRGADYR
jgi:Protein of unknown function (DUF2934)